MTNQIAFDVGGTWARVVDGTKTVTRRLHPFEIGEIYEAMKGGNVVGSIQIVSCESTTLADVTQAEVDAEGFPGKSPEWFCELLLMIYRERLYRFGQIYRVGFVLVSVVESPQGSLDFGA